MDNNEISYNNIIVRADGRYELSCEQDNMNVYVHVKRSVTANKADCFPLVRNTCLVSKLQPGLQEYVIG